MYPAEPHKPQVYLTVLKKVRYKNQRHPFRVLLYRAPFATFAALTDSVIDKVIFEFVSSLARGGLEIGAVRRVKQSAKQFEGKARSESQK